MTELERKTIPIKEVYAGMYDGPHATPKPSDSGPVFLGIKNVGESGQLDLSDVRHISEAEYPRWTKRVEPKFGDIVFSYEATLNRYAMIPQGFRGCLGRRMALIRPDETKACGRFLYFYFFGPEWRSVIARNTLVGSTVDRIPIAKFPDFPITLPPLPAQRKIAAVLSAYDDLIENNLRRIKILEEMAQNLYREWFVKFRFPGHQHARFIDSPLGPIPQGWEVQEFRNLFYIKYGRTLPKTKIAEAGPYPVYGAGDVIGFYDEVLCQEKCALVTSRGNGSGTVWRTREAAFVTNNSLMILPRAELKHWHYCFIELLLKHSNVMEAKTGSAQPQVTIENLNYVKGIVPEKDCVVEFCSLVAPISEQVDLYLLKNTALRRTRDLLLPKLISGEVDVSELDIAVPEEANA